MVLPHCHQHFGELYRCWLALWAAAHLPGVQPSCGGEGAAWERGTAAFVASLAGGLAGAAAVAGVAPQLAAVAAAAVDVWEARRRGGRPDPSAAERLLFLV